MIAYVLDASPAIAAAQECVFLSLALLELTVRVRTACHLWASAKDYPGSDTAPLRPDTVDVESASPASCAS